MEPPTFAFIELQWRQQTNKYYSKGKTTSCFFTCFVFFAFFCIFSYKHAKFWDSIIVVAILVHNPILTPPNTLTLTPLTSLYLSAWSRVPTTQNCKIGLGTKFHSIFFYLSIFYLLYISK